MKVIEKRSFCSILMVMMLASVLISSVSIGTGEVMKTKETEQYGNEKIEVIYRNSLPIEESKGLFPALSPGVSMEDGIVMERDVGVTMRDGVTLYVDIYRPQGEVNLPALIACSPYGKRQGYLGRPVAGVPNGTTSPMAKFEGPDPAYWCRYGYAVVNPDIRGTGNSEGDAASFCGQEARDNYDLIEWLADQYWCNGKIAMTGNSYLAISQWFAAAERPPHLAAIAPWEGFDDFYRDSLFAGGIPEVGFVGRGIGTHCGPNRVLDTPEMMEKYPLMNAFWEDRVAKVENIEVPAYVVASYTNNIHTAGTIDGFRRISSENKWLRIHNTHEWGDYYRPENIRDLHLFFDRYLKGIRNGWELTPRVRMAVLDPGGKDQVNRPEEDFPPRRTRHEKLFLDAATGTLSPHPVTKESEISYKPENRDYIHFTIAFDEDTELTGYMKLRLWVEADGSDDMDLFVYVNKLDDQRNPLYAEVLGRPWAGAKGLLRVSRRELDKERSTPSEPYLTHRREQLLKPGEIVPVEIGIWPLSMLWHKGQQLQVIIQGYDMGNPTKREPSGLGYVLRNKGDHIIHTGGKYDSHLLIPKTPLKP